MKNIIFLAISLFLVSSLNSASAADPCGGVLPPLTTNADIATLLEGHTVCTTDSQEQHRANNELWDYKKGNDPVDPTSQVGTWSISNNQVHYTYGNTTYNNTVYSNGNNICFDNGTTTVSATKLAGISGPCP